MKRLTDERAVIPPEQFLVLSEEEVQEYESNIPSVPYKELYYRLGLIENVLGDDYDLDRLRELVQADRRGRCVVLPCKVGDMIHKLDFSEERGLFFISDKVTSVTTNKNGWTVKTKKVFYPIKESDEYDFAPLSQCPNALADFYVGTMKEAEAALEKMKAERK